MSSRSEGGVFLVCELVHCWAIAPVRHALEQVYFISFLSCCVFWIVILIGEGYLAGNLEAMYVLVSWANLQYSVSTIVGGLNV